MEKVYLNDNDSSNIELVENSRMIPKFFNCNEKAYRLSLSQNQNTAFIIYLNKKDIMRLITSINEALFLNRQSQYNSHNKVYKEDSYKYSERRFKIKHERSLKLNILPLHNESCNCNKVSSINIVPSIFYKIFFIPIKYRKLQANPFIIDRFEAQYLISSLETLVDYN